jgi:hypothetical protein
MKKILLIINCSLLISLFSCQSKTEKLLCKQWDCIKVENLEPVDTRFQTPEDSTRVAQAEAAMKSLSWTFKKDGTYTTATAGRMAVQGSYVLDEKEKTLKLITNSQNNVSYFTINALAENEMILSSEVNRKNIVLHFAAAFQ